MLKIGVVGSGFMGSTHAAAWAKTAGRIGWYCSADQERAEKLAAEYGAKPFTSFDALLQQVDVLDICTPTHLHHEMVLQAAAAGKHIVCEKPLARTLDQAREMIAACDKAGVICWWRMSVRFFTGVCRWRKRLSNAGRSGQSRRYSV